MDSKTNLIRKPFGVVFTAPLGTTSSFKVPTGWVIQDLSICGFNGANASFSASSDVNATTIQQYSDDDLQGKNLPLSLDFISASSFYPSNSMVLSWSDIGKSEYRSIQLQASSAGWSDETLVIWGVLIPDPRCFQG